MIKKSFNKFIIPLINSQWRNRFLKECFKSNKSNTIITRPKLPSDPGNSAKLGENRKSIIYSYLSRQEDELNRIIPRLTIFLSDTAPYLHNASRIEAINPTKSFYQISFCQIAERPHTRVSSDYSCNREFRDTIVLFGHDDKRGNILATFDRWTRILS